MATGSAARGKFDGRGASSRGIPPSRPRVVGLASTGTTSPFSSKIAALEPGRVVLRRVAQPIGGNRPRMAGPQYEAGRRRDHVIGRNLFDQARAFELATGIQLDVRRERDAEVLVRPLGRVGKRQSENTGGTFRRRPVAIEVEGCCFAAHRIGSAE